MRRESQRQVWLEEQDDAAELAERRRKARPDDARDRKCEQNDDGPEHEDEVAVDHPRLPDVLDEDNDEDRDECELQCDVDGVHGSLGADDAWARGRS